MYILYICSTFLKFCKYAKVRKYETSGWRDMVERKNK